MIAILDYGLGNLGSISNMLKVIGERSRITNEKETIEMAAYSRVSAHLTPE